MNFSIVLCSRQRSTLLVNLMRSIAETTGDLDNVEVLVGIDDDDAESHDAKVHITGWHKFVKFFSRPRSDFLNAYLNWLYEYHGSGRYIIICNDDCEFKTKNWDQIALKKLETYLADKPDRAVYGYIADALIDRLGMNYCCFPLVSREGSKALQWSISPDFSGWGADIENWKVYLANNRICDLSEIMIEHIAYHSGKRGRDAVSYRVQEISYKYPIIVRTPEYIERLRQYIASYPK